MEWDNFALEENPPLSPRPALEAFRTPATPSWLILLRLHVGGGVRSGRPVNSVVFNRLLRRAKRLPLVM